MWTTFISSSEFNIRGHAFVMFTKNDIFKRKQFLETFRVWEGNDGLNLMSQYQPCIPDKCHVVNKIFHNFEIRLWKCYHVTMNNLPFTFFVKLTQRCRNVVIPSSRRRYEFEVTVTTLYRRCHFNIHNMLWGDFFVQRWSNVGYAIL